MSEEITRVCPTCGKAFETKYPRKIFCSRACQHRNYYLANRKGWLAYASLKYAEMLEKLESDPEEYTRRRKQTRLACRRNYEKKNPGCRAYKPRLCRRIPDWAVKGQETLDRRSAFLPGNMSDDKVMAANAIYVEQHAAESSKPKRVKTVFRGR